MSDLSEAAKRMTTYVRLRWWSRVLPIVALITWGVGMLLEHLIEKLPPNSEDRLMATFGAVVVGIVISGFFYVGTRSFLLDLEAEIFPRDRRLLAQLLEQAQADLEEAQKRVDAHKKGLEKT